MLKQELKDFLHEGSVIPAYPLALTEDRKLDEKGQRALARYYIDAGAGGIAVGVHTTQFEIRDPEFQLFEKVLTIAAEEMDNYKSNRPFLKIAGVCGENEQATYEATFAKDLGYDMGLLSFRGLNHFSEEVLIEHTKNVAEIIPVFGFYLQPAVGGRELSFDFWKKFADIPNVHAIKMAPFDRYRTLDVVRAVCHSERRDEIALYTGNDDNIITDLITEYEVPVDGELVRKHIVGGLLGHWAAWTKNAVEQFEHIKHARENGESMDQFHALSNQVTDVNAAFFDVRNNFKGCIAGINEILARQGILQGNWCLLDKEKLSTGQSEEIDRVYREYPDLHDDDFVKENLENWFS